MPVIVSRGWNCAKSEHLNMLKKNKPPCKTVKSETKPGFDLPVVLSLTGIVAVVAAIGLATLNGKMVDEGMTDITSMMGSSEVVNAPAKPDISMEIARLDKKLADISMLLKTISSTQTTTTSRVEKIEEAFSPTASISNAAVQSSSPYFRIQESGWNADDMVTRTQKRDRVALFETLATIPDIDQEQGDSNLPQARYAVDLSSYENIITARKKWEKFKLIYPDLFIKLEPNLLPVLDSKDEKDQVKLVIGPIKTAARAAQICSILRSSGQACQERVFSLSNVAVVSVPENRPEKSTE